MKKILMFLMVFVLMLMSLTMINTTYAAETTEVPTTEATETNQEEDIYINDEGNFVVNGIELTKEEVTKIAFKYLDENFGDKLGAVGGIVIGVIVILIGMGAVAIKKVATNTSETRELNKTNSKISDTKESVDTNTTSIQKLEAREAKTQAMIGEVLKGLNIVMANSTNPNILGAAQGYKSGVEKVMNIDDNLKESLNIVKQATKDIKEVFVGKTAEEKKKERAKILNQMNNEEE